MAVNSTGIPLFAGVEDLDDMFIATMEEMDKEVADEITIAHPLWQFIEKRNFIEYRDSIGTHVNRKIADKPNTTVKDFTHYDDVDNTPQDLLSEAKFAYGHIVGTQMYSREELTKNAGKEQLIDLVEEKAEQLKASMTNHFGDKIIGTQDSDGRSFMGIGRIVTPDIACGGINPATAGFAYWNPHKGLQANGSQWALATEFRAGLRRLTRQLTYRGDHPDVQVCGEDVYEEHQKWAEEHLRLNISEIKKSSGWGDFEMFDYTGKTIIYDDTLAPKEAWILNFTHGVKVRIHSGTNFQFQPWQMMNNKVAKKRDMLLYASVYCKRRNTNGRIVYT